MNLPLALVPGTIVGSHYIVGDRLNSGGFGAVYRGVDTSEGNRACAIKETYNVTPAARRQALMEASVLLTVQSNHLPEVYDAFEANGRFYLVMQLIEGHNLLQALSARVGNGAVGRASGQAGNGPCSEQEVLAWLLPIMDILQELHSRHPPVLHRDIKPGNIILTPQQTAVLVDFGLTRLYDPKKSTQTMIKAVTEGFSPLEQYLGTTSPQSDIYALAATMYLLLTNCLPPAAINRSIHDELVAPCQLNASLSPQTEQALLKALALNADQRYQSMQEFASALQRPAFCAHSDPTIAVAPPVSPQLSPHAPPAYAYMGVRQSPGWSRVPAAPPPVYPYALPPSGQRMQPQQVVMMQPAKPLPGAFGQGCLWGLLQGIVAALLVLFLRKEADFYLAIFTGFVFYVIAGFSTTRRGGSSWRGASAGSWAGILGTIFFWLVLGVGLAVRITQRLQAEALSAQKHHTSVKPGEIAQAVREALPAIPGLPTLHNQPGWLSLALFLIIGIAISYSLGWLGGLLGTSFHKTKGGRTR